MSDEQRGVGQDSGGASAERHVDIVVRVWVVYSVLLVFGGLAAMGALLAIGGEEQPAGEMLLVSISGLPGLVGAMGVRARRRWARVLLIVMAVISLVSFPPIGTAIGGYTLWALLKRDGARLFSGCGIQEESRTRAHPRPSN